ncbi:hypothetical protein ACP26L_31775 [Paenibacillus sp. S-38]|uniref:hypothetical protein n=1 Tax=Paenibacillus sp. S-38 TaxID=3416710 RepID=UPI003CE99103
MERIVYQISEQISLNPLGTQPSQHWKQTVPSPESACPFGADEKAVHGNPSGSSTLEAPLLTGEART